MPPPAVSLTPAAPSAPSLQEATKNSTAAWQKHLDQLFHHCKERFPDVVWELTGEDDDQPVEEVYGHKAIVYARAPPTFQNRYFSIRQHQVFPYSQSPMDDNPSASAVSLGWESRVDSRASSPAPSSLPPPITGPLLRIPTSHNPALFSNELEYLYTGQGLGEAFEFLFDASDSREEGDADELRIDKLRKDLVFMWRSRLYSDVRLSLTGNFSSANHETTTAVFATHRFILVSRCPYFHTALVSWPKQIPQTPGEPLTLELPSPPFTPASLHFTLGFIYTGTLVFSHRTYDLETAFHIMRSATYLGLDTLYDEIQARIATEMMHGLFHAFLEFQEYERITGGKWGTGGCRCRQCARRAPRVLEFASGDDVKNPHLDRGARRALVGLFGEGWCTTDFANLPQKTRESLLKGVGKRTSPMNVFALLFAAEHALAKISAVIDAWADTVREMILSERKVIDDVICSCSADVFEQPDWLDLMHSDGQGFDDLERVSWVMAAVGRGVNERNAGVLYQTLVGSVLLRPHPTEINKALLSSNSRLREQVENTRVDVLRFIGKRWLNIRQEGGFEPLEGWALKEISDNIDVALDDLELPASTRKHPRHSHKSLLISKPEENDAMSVRSVRVSVLSRNGPRRGSTPTHEPVLSSGASIRSTRTTHSTASRVTVGGGSSTPRRKPTDLSHLGPRPDSKLTPGPHIPPLPSPSPSPSPQPSIHQQDDDPFDDDAEPDEEQELEMRQDPDMRNTPSSPVATKTLVSRVNTSSSRRSVSSSRSGMTSPAAPLRPRPSNASITPSLRSHHTVRKSSGGSTHTSLHPSGPSRPTSGISHHSSVRDSTATFRTANSNVDGRSRRPSTASSMSNLSVRTANVAPSTHSPSPSPVRTRKVSNSSTTSTTTTNTATTRSVSASMAGNRRPAPTTPRGRDPNRLDPSTAAGSPVRRTTSTASVSSVRSSTSSVSTTTSASKKVLVTIRKPPSASNPTTPNDSPKVGSVPLEKSVSAGSAKSAASSRSVSSRTSKTSKASNDGKPVAPPLSRKSSSQQQKQGGSGDVTMRDDKATTSSDKDRTSIVTSSDDASMLTAEEGSLPSAIDDERKRNASLPPLPPSASTADTEHKKSDSANSVSTIKVKRKGSADTITTVSRKAASDTQPAKKQQQQQQPPPPQAQTTEQLPRGATLEVGIPCIINSKRKRFKAFARYIGEVEGEIGPWVGVEVPFGDNWSGDREKIENDGRLWHDGSWGGIRYFEIGNGGSEWGDYGEDRIRRRRMDWVGGGGGGGWNSWDKGYLKREGDSLSIHERAKRFRSVSPAISDMSTSESRGLFVRPQQVLYVVDAVGSDL